MTNAWIPSVDIHGQVHADAAHAVPAGSTQKPWILPDGTLVTQDRIETLFLKYGWFWTGGSQSTPITFAGAYDADGPDFFAHIPGGYTVVPTSFVVDFQTVGTVLLLEVMSSLHNLGDASATVSGGALATEVPANAAAGTSSPLTVSVAVDAAGVTDPNGASINIDLFHFSEQLAINAADANDGQQTFRHYEWSRKADPFSPYIRVPVGSTGSWDAHCASQAGTGFIRASALVIPNSLADVLFGN